MQKKLVASLILLTNLLMISKVTAAPSQEAEDLARNAAIYLQAYGPETAFKAFQDPRGEFMAEGRYVFVFDLDGYAYAMGPSPHLIGKNLLGLMSADNRPIIREMIRLINQKGEGWYRYQWRNPDTQHLQTKAIFVQRVPNTPYWIGSGTQSGAPLSR